MKKLFVLIALVGAAFSYQSANAQLRIGASVTIGNVPTWCPADYAYAGNYYFPDMDMYYCIADRQYRYLDRGRWVCSPVLPGRYRNVDMFHVRRVAIHERNPYLRHDYWRGKYSNDNRRGHDRPDFRNDRRSGRDNRDYRDNRSDNHRGSDRRH